MAKVDIDPVVELQEVLDDLGRGVAAVSGSRSEGEEDELGVGPRTA